jgi:hypothetical protein
MAARWGSDNQLYKRYIAELVNLYGTRSDIRAFTEVILSVIAIFVFGVFALRPTLTTIGGLTTDISQKRDTLAQMDQKITNIATAQSLYDSQKANIDLLQIAVPTTPSVFEYLGQIELVAKKDGVQMTSLTTERVPLLGETPVAPVEAQPKEITDSSVNFAVTFTGTYAGLFQTLSDIEHLRRPNLSKNVFMSSETTLTGTVITLTITGTVPYIKN